MASQPTAPSGVSVPFLDFAPMHRPLKERLVQAIDELLESGAFTNGSWVGEFETAFAEYCEAPTCVGVASGLDALRLALIAGDLQPGAEIVVPAATFVATAEAITQAGGRPVLVDVLDSDYCMDPAAVESALTPRTQWIMPVHLYGQMADMRALRATAARHGVRLIEDACQAHGAERDGVKAGSSSDAAAFSFYPGKNLGAAGDAGALVTNDDELATRVRALREHGQTAKYVHAFEGWTARLDTIQALVLAHKLPHLDAWNEDRRDVARAYEAGLAGVGDLVLPPVAEGSNPVWHLYVVRTADPSALGTALRERGIGTGRHYPDPVHLTAAYEHLGYGRGAFPAAERLARECLSLPIFPGMTGVQVEAVVDGVRSFFDG
jgi:dTDP-4-amino-4,6-dideoxygalactose transaminase